MGEKSSNHGSNSSSRERRSSLFSVLKVFKAGGSSRGRRSGVDGGGGAAAAEAEADIWDVDDEAVSMRIRRLRHSDEDKECWVAEPDIDRKASAFIARFYESRVSESDVQTIAPPVGYN